MISKQNWKFCFQTPETVWTVFHVTSVLKQAESLWILAMYECALHGIVLTCGCSDDDGLGTCSRAHAVILLQQCLQLLVYSLVSYIQRLAVDDPTISDTDHIFAHTVFHRMGKPPSSFHLEDFFGCSFNCTSIFFEQRRVRPHSSCCYVRPTFVVIPSVTLSLTKSVKFSGGN